MPKRDLNLFRVSVWKSKSTEDVEYVSEAKINDIVQLRDLLTKIRVEIQELEKDNGKLDQNPGPRSAATRASNARKIEILNHRSANIADKIIQRFSDAY